MYDQDKIGKTRVILRAINHSLRVKILEYISESEADVSAGDIHRGLGIAQSACSPHLRILKEAGLVNTYKMGTYIYYSTNRECIDALIKATDELSQFARVGSFR